ncbi:MAG: endonuclease/exonuclease/phosphatase family protein, partial [Chloroflexi bacterium]|nr:endonuclease/exonuclease/phosphatase family protein [Chloroflexota bacterium]
VVAAGLLLALRETVARVGATGPGEGGRGGALALAGVGPWLFLQLVVWQNVARAAAATGWSLPAAGGLLVLGNALGLGAAVRARQTLPGKPLLAAVAGGLLALLALDAAALTGWAAAVDTILGLVLSGMLLVVIAGSGGEDRFSSGETRREAIQRRHYIPTVANGVGQILFVVLSFAYYVSYDLPLGFRSATVLPVAALLVAVAAAGAARGRRTVSAVWPADYAPVLAGLVLLLCPVGLALTWRTPETVEPAADNATVRLMDYNLHNGFNTAGRLDLEAVAQVIEANDPDVVGLQEVSRGWIINGSVDMLQWLSQRLAMPYVSGPTGDLVWGNAILSRYPIISAENVPIPPRSLLLLRGYVVAEIDAGRSTLRIVNTHLHHVEDDSVVRQEQVPALLAGWNGAPRTVIMGDLNATPDSPEMQQIAAAGLVDVAAAVGTPPIYTYYAADPNRQIDYIWSTPDLAASDFAIPRTTASDHLPMFVTLTLP